MSENSPSDRHSPGRAGASTAPTRISWAFQTPGVLVQKTQRDSDNRCSCLRQHAGCPQDAGGVNADRLGELVLKMNRLFPTGVPCQNLKTIAALLPPSIHGKVKLKTEPSLSMDKASVRSTSSTKTFFGGKGAMRVSSMAWPGTPCTST